MKAQFTVNPFEELNLTPGDRTSLQDLANQVIMSNLQMCMKYMNNKLRVDLNHWKPLKWKDNVQVYSERPEGVSAAVAAVNEPTGAGLPMILCVGTKEGKLDDLMYGVPNEDLETMRMKASYVNDFSGAAMLEFVVLPSLEDPFQSLVIKWMELDIPFSSTSLVKNRDYVYMEGRDMSRILLASDWVTTSCTPSTSHRLTDYRTAFVATSPSLGFGGRSDPTRWKSKLQLVVPNMASLFLSSLRYAYCGRMRKLGFMLERRYEESKINGAPNKKSICVTCSSPITRRIGDFGKSNSTCKLCFGFACSACTIVRKLSFVDADLLLSQRKVTFCKGCFSEVLGMSAADVARASLMAKKRLQDANSSVETALSSGRNSTDLSYCSQ